MPFEQQRCVCEVNQLSISGYAADPINTYSGNFNYKEVDFTIPIAGFPLQFIRSYNHQASETYTQPLGAGWTHNYQTYLIIPSVTTTPVTWVDPIGREFLFNQVVEGSEVLYFGRPGVRGHLTRTGSSPYTYTLTMPNQMVYTFNDNGQIVGQEDALGNGLVFNYTTGGLLSQVSDSTVTRYLTFTYNVTGNISAITDSIGRVWTYGYSAGNLTTATSPLILTTTYAYHASHGRMITRHDPSGLHTFYNTYTLDSEAGVYRVVSQTQGSDNNILYEFEYGDGGTVTITKDGQISRIDQYSPNGALAYQENATGDRSRNGTDINFNKSGVVDANGNGTQIRQDAQGVVKGVTDPLGNNTSLGYDSLNNLTEVVDAEANITVYGYHHANLLTFRTHITDSQGNTTIFTPTYGLSIPDGLLAAQQQPDGTITAYSYSQFGEMTQQVVATGTANALTSTYGFDNVGRLITTTREGGGEKITNLSVYDAGDRLIASIQNWTGTTTSTWKTDCDMSSGERETNLCTRYGYDEAGRTISTTNTLGQTNLTFYDSAGRVITSVINYDGTTAYGSLCAEGDNDTYNICTLTGYDGQGRIVTTTQTNVAVRQNVTEYDDNSRVQRQINNYVDGVYDDDQPDEDIITMYEYDAVGNTISVTTFVSETFTRTTRTFYDELNRVSTSIENWTGITTADCDSQPAIRDENICTKYQYDALGRQTVITDSLGQATYTVYNSLGQTVATVRNYDADNFTSVAASCILTPNNAITTNICTLMGYDENGRQVTTTNALSQTNLTVYDTVGRPFIQVTNWDEMTLIDETSDCDMGIVTATTNLCTITTYDLLGRRASVTDPLSRTTAFGYDSLGRLITTTQYLNGEAISQTVSMDALGNRLSQTDVNGHTTTFTYDSLNRQIATFSHEGVGITTTYDARGWVTATANAEHTTLYGYDQLGRRTTTTNPKGNVSQQLYDGQGQVWQIIDAEGITTTYEYDGLNRLVTVIENDVAGTTETATENVTTRYLHDALGQQISSTNAAGYTVSLTAYDDLGRPMVVTDVLNNETETAYNALGLRTIITDANGESTYFTYDDLNRLTQIHYATDDAYITYTYDVAGQRLSMTDTLGTSYYAYDDLGRLITYTHPLTGMVVYAYDYVGNRTGLTYPDGRIVTNTYDADNRLIQVEDWDNLTTTYGYDDLGRLITTTLANGVVTVNSYDSANQLTSITHSDDSGGVLASYNYILDKMGNRLQEVAVNEFGYELKVLASSPGVNDEFGYSVAIDGNTMVVGAPHYDTVAETNTGAVYIYEYRNSSWVEQAIFTVTDTLTPSQFGSGVAINGDTLVARGHNGPAYIFTRSNGTWTQTQVISPTGYTVATGEEVAINDNGWIVMNLLGYGCNSPCVDKPSALAVFTPTNGVWAEESIITSTAGITASRSSWFIDVAIYDQTIIAGADQANLDGEFNDGSVYVFDVTGSGWSQIAVLTGTAGVGVSSEYLGYSVSLADDRILAGAYNARSNGSSGDRSGISYAFEYSTTNWIETSAFAGISPAEDDQFGYDVALSDDGQAALIGANGRTVNGISNAGIAYIYHQQTDDSWEYAHTIGANNPVTNTLVGSAVALSSPHYVVGAHQDSQVGTQAGAVYVVNSNATTTITYQYDPLYRVTNAVYTGSVAAEFGYLYDAVGNMTVYTETITSTQVTTRTVNERNQLTMTNQGGVTTTMHYDANGNLIGVRPSGETLTVGAKIYGFDQRNLMVTATVYVTNSYQAVADYHYDGNRTRLQQIVYNGTTPITTTYIHDLQGLAQVLVAESDTATNYYLMGHARIAQDNGSEMRYLLTDGLGSVRVEMVGNTIETINTYEPYGDLLHQTGSSGTVYGFAGEEFDEDTGLIYLRARYYSSELMQFMGRDAYAGQPRVPGTMHGYDYAYGNPVLVIDPSGNYGFEKNPNDSIINPYEGVRCAAESNPKYCGSVMSIEIPPSFALIDKSAPDLYIVGLSGHAFVWKLGYEYVFDFKTNELTSFRFYGATIGMDIIGMDIGTSRGLAYKGDFAESLLEEAYSGAFYCLGGSIQLPFDAVSAGSDFFWSGAGDHHFFPKSSGSSFWETAPMRFDAIGGGAIGVGVGHSANPLPFSVHFDTTNYRVSKPSLTSLFARYYRAQGLTEAQRDSNFINYITTMLWPPLSPQEKALLIALIKTNKSEPINNGTY